MFQGLKGLSNADLGQGGASLLLNLEGMSV